MYALRGAPSLRSMHAYQPPAAACVRAACCALRCILRAAASCMPRVALRGRAAVCALHAERYVSAAWSPRCVYRTDRQADRLGQGLCRSPLLPTAHLTRFGCACCGRRQRGDNHNTNNNGSDRWRVAALTDGWMDGWMGWSLQATWTRRRCSARSAFCSKVTHCDGVNRPLRSGMAAAAHAAYSL